MSNKVSFVPTEFKDVRDGTSTVGFRAYDDSGQTYDNTWDSIPDDDLEVLKMVLVSNDEIVLGMLEWIVETSQGCYIGSTWYTHDQISVTLGQQ